MLEVDEFEQFRSRAYSAGSFKECRSRRCGDEEASPKLRRVSSHRGPSRPSYHKPTTPLTPSPLVRTVDHQLDHRYDEQQLCNRVDSLMSFDRESINSSCFDSEYDNDEESELDSVSRTGRLDDFGSDTEVFRPLTPLGWTSNNSYGSRSPCRINTPPSFSPKHTRSYSCKAPSRPQRPRELELFPGKPRQRTYSMPTRNRFRKAREKRREEEESGGDAEYYRVRTFSTAGKHGTKGIINRGDSFKRRSAKGSTSSEVVVDDFRPRTWSATSQGSSVCSAGSVTSDPSKYKVLVIGSPGVGKTSLIQQFMTSEYLGNTCSPGADTVAEDNDESTSVSVLLDGQESMLDFMDIPDADEITRDVRGDGYVIVYSIADRESFDDAVEILHELRKDESTHNAAVILVANKGDIVRNREVTEEEGKVMAVRYVCKYIEVSAVLNHKVDELLVGILKQIRLHSTSKKSSKQRHRNVRCLSNDNGCLVQHAARGIVGKLLKKHNIVFRSCDNLLV